jgi:phosphoribosylpyrophosphate synthetase
MDLHASQIQGFFDVPVDKYVCPYPLLLDLLIMSRIQRKFPHLLT